MRTYLAQADLKAAWERLESRWHDVEAKVRELDGSPKEKIEEIGKALGGMLGEIRTEYRRFDD